MDTCGLLYTQNFHGTEIIYRWVGFSEILSPNYNILLFTHDFGQMPHLKQNSCNQSGHSLFLNVNLGFHVCEKFPPSLSDGT